MSEDILDLRKRLVNNITKKFVFEHRIKDIESTIDSYKDFEDSSTSELIDRLGGIKQILVERFRKILIEESNLKQTLDGETL